MASSFPPGFEPPGISLFIFNRAAELAVGAAVWFGLHELAHLRLTPAEWSAVLAGWFALWTLAAAGRQLHPARIRWWRGMEWLLPLAVLGLCNGRLSSPLDPGRLLYAGLVVGAAASVWRAWAGWRVRHGADAVAEPLRVLSIGAAALVALLPFFTDRLMGGTDARWYAFMLRDFIDQLRAGVFPVFIGQGEFAWNGAVHPFRSAPVYMHVAGFWDFLTLRALNAPALQHLTVISAGLGGALGFYAAAAALLPTRRWVAAAFSVLYAVAPAWLGVLYCADAYMTFMALGALPAVLYGNARSLISEDQRGYGWLAAGLAALWMSHPPTAMLATLATILLQSGSFLFGRAPRERWRGAIGGALLFGGLAGYYFASMSELPKAPGAGREDAFQIGGLLLAIAGLANGFLMGRSRWWLAAVPAGAWLAAQGRVPWGWWMVATTVLVAVAAVLLRRVSRDATKRHACAILCTALLVGAGLAQVWCGPEHPARNQATLAGLKTNQSNLREFFLPVDANLATEGNFQPGTGLWIVLPMLAWSFWRAEKLAVKLFFVAASLPCFALARVPWISDFLLGYAPNGLVQVVNLTLPIRIMPILSALLAMGGVTAWACAATDARASWRQRGCWVLLAMAVGWGLWETTPFAKRGWSMIESRTRTEDKFRPENLVLDRFTYDLLPHPAYLSHGHTDPWLQARVLDKKEKVVIGPDQTAALMELGGARRVRLTVRKDAANPVWVHVAPDVAVPPGEKFLLRFEFDPKINYGGYLIWTATHGYREYRLPASGLPLAFGADVTNSRVISIENTTEQTADYHLTMPREAVNTLRGDGDFFADLVISRYDPARASVRVDELMPRYRVTATVPTAGWIETSRVWLPGYRATLDGKRVETKASQQGLAMVAVGPGRHELELHYVGTGKLWAALALSALTWLGWLFPVVRRVQAGASAG